jgi:hypothetical protein
MLFSCIREVYFREAPNSSCSSNKMGTHIQQHSDVPFQKPNMWFDNLQRDVTLYFTRKKTCDYKRVLCNIFQSPQMDAIRFWVERHKHHRTSTASIFLKKPVPLGQYITVCLSRTWHYHHLNYRNLCLEN